MDHDHDRMPERVTRLEEGMEEVRGAVGRIGKQLDGVLTELNRANRTPWGILIGFGSFVLAAGGGLYSLGTAPTNSRLDVVDRTANRNQDRIQILEVQHAAKIEKLAEMETQFRESLNIANLRHQSDFQLINLTRREAGLEPVDPGTFWPIGGSGGHVK